MIRRPYSLLSLALPLIGLGCGSPNVETLADASAHSGVVVDVSSVGLKEAAYVLISLVDLRESPDDCLRVDASATFDGIAMRVEPGTRKKLVADPNSPTLFRQVCSATSFRLDEWSFSDRRAGTPIAIEISDGTTRWSVTFDDFALSRKVTVESPADGKLHVGQRATIGIGTDSEAFESFEIEYRTSDDRRLYEDYVIDAEIQREGASLSFDFLQAPAPQAVQLMVKGKQLNLGATTCNGPTSCAAMISTVGWQPGLFDVVP